MRLSKKQTDDLWAVIITFIMIGFFLGMALVSSTK